ncbi:MAG: rhodanese-like domain-containing protein [Gammaproteobacteria bacterium]|nr:rhodanese-like domain-containing protein [Gammaproteobacteria bacterium]MDH3464517.1 rhodanese-like domain-containing protein [Gammaproteobacteria bacterium]
MPDNLKKLLAEANAVIDTVSVHDALTQVDDPRVLLVDVRETAERQNNGVIPGAVHVPRGFLEFIADPNGPMHNEAMVSGRKLLLFCATGGRSTLATKTLMDMGFVDVAHIAGGFSAWREAGGPIELTEPSSQNAG